MLFIFFLFPSLFFRFSLGFFPFFPCTFHFALKCLRWTLLIFPLYFNFLDYLIFPFPLYTPMGNIFLFYKSLRIAQTFGGCDDEQLSPGSPIALKFTSAMSYDISTGILTPPLVGLYRSLIHHNPRYSPCLHTMLHSFTRLLARICAIVRCTYFN